MAVNFRVHTPTIDKRIKFLSSDMKKNLLLAGNEAVKHMRTNWSKGLGADEVAMKKLTPKYSARKVRKGGRPIPDLYLSGGLYKSLKVIKANAKQAIVGFAGSKFNKIASGNYQLRKNMAELSERFKNKIVGFTFKLMVGNGTLR